MHTIVECIPNFSEGRRPEVIEQIVAAMTSVPNVVLLGAESDPNHNRSVITIAGLPEAVLEAAVRGVGKAAELIDLNHHTGEHPRMGATDVVPFVPIRNITMDECVKLARRAGERMYKEFGVPVYLYEKAATRPDRANLADIRKGQFEGIREEVKTNPNRRPDFGEAELHPTAGATVVGARPALIAYNINLNTPDVSIAKKIAKAIRGRDGGLMYVKALGFDLKDRNQAQVSMNMVNHEGTPLFRVFEMVRSEADRYGVSIVGSEIVGLVPQAALVACNDFYLRLENFSDEQILEVRLQKALAEQSQPAAPKVAETEENGSVLGSFPKQVAAGTPVPGGGSVSAFVASLGAALGQMMCNMTAGKPKYAAVEGQVLDIRGQLEALQQTLEQRIDEDAASFDAVLAARRLPKESDADKLARATAIQEATKHAATVPFRMAHEAFDLLELLSDAAEIGNPNLLCDVTVAAQLAVAAIKGAHYNVLVNLTGIDSAEFNEEYRSKMAELLQRAQELAGEIEERYFASLQ
ncbi:MAG: glutamate formimidoyltransferase [Blastocatellia bacterium]|nr:glutamate formimidoyltransferase [Blastocatellia bacterium]